VIRDEAGQVGGIEAAVFGVLVFVLGTLVIANGWGVVDAKLAASAAAREGARAVVEASHPSPEVAVPAVDATIAAHGRDPARVVDVAVEGAVRRCGRMTVAVSYRVPIVAVPLIGATGRGFTVTGRHSELVDPYRSGLPGEADCG
jgi:hypothetical protein